MSATGVSSALPDRRLRANPAYELVAFDALHPDERAQLGSLPADADLFGLLRRRDIDGPLKAVGHDTARLFDALAHPARIAELRGLDPPDDATLERLVLGGVLELEDGGRFVSGPAAEPALSTAGDPALDGTRLGRLSTSALRYAATLPIDDPSRLSARIYFFNRVPAGPRWHRLFPDQPAVRRFLGIDDGGRNRDALDAWDETLPGSDGGWVTWRSRRRRDPGDGAGARGATYKLYVSPLPEDAAVAFDATLRALDRLALPCRFKVGADAHGLLRPDKIVVYLDSRDEVERVADELAPAIGELRPHGVPFTAERAADGLLSWGADPPRRTAPTTWWERESWRTWITNRLAAAIVSARAEGAAEQSWRFALRRLEAEGVDPATWTPRRLEWLDGGAR